MIEDGDHNFQSAFQELHEALDGIKRVKIWSLESNIDSMQNRVTDIERKTAKISKFPREDRITDNFHSVALKCVREVQYLEYLEIFSSIKLELTLILIISASFLLTPV